MSKRQRSAVWTYFDKERGETEPVCTICGESVKTSGNTSNLLKHLTCKHEKKFKLVNEEQEAVKRMREEQTPLKQPRQVTLKVSMERAQGYGRESLRRKKIDEALVRMLAIDLQPASIVEDRGFRTFCESLIRSTSLLAAVPS